MYRIFPHCELFPCGLSCIIHLFELGGCFSLRGIPHSMGCGNTPPLRGAFTSPPICTHFLTREFLHRAYIVNVDSRFTCGKGLVFWFLPQGISPPGPGSPAPCHFPESGGRVFFFLMEGARLEAGTFFRTPCSKALPCIGLNARRRPKDDQETARTMQGHSKLRDSPAGRLGGAVKVTCSRGSKKATWLELRSRGRVGGGDVSEGSLPAPRATC